MPKAEEGENADAVDAALDVASLFQVAGKVVLVTGGGSGIGAMIASGFVQCGCQVYIASRKDCSHYAAELTRKGPGSCFARVCDVMVAEQRKALIDDLWKEAGKLHVLVNNSGTNLNVKLDKHTPETFNKVMDVNCNSVFDLTRLAAHLLEASSTRDDPGRVINISSVNGLQAPIIDNFGYSASKAAIVMLSKHLASALGPKHITVNTICPGPFYSRMTRGTIRAIGEDSFMNTALGRMGAPRDAAGCCIFLSSAAGSFLTGTEFAMDGGALVARPSSSKVAKL